MLGNTHARKFVLFGLILISLACATFQPSSTAPPTPDPSLTATQTLTPIASQTPRPSPTLRPTWTPDLATTQHVEQLNGQVETYYSKGHLATRHGRMRELEDFRYDWARIGWYNWLPLGDSASDFFLSAHFKWNSALESSNTSGC